MEACDEKCGIERLSISRVTVHRVAKYLESLELFEDCPRSITAQVIKAKPPRKPSKLTLH